MPAPRMFMTAHHAHHAAEEAGLARTLRRWADAHDRVAAAPGTPEADRFPHRDLAEGFRTQAEVRDEDAATHAGAARHQAALAIRI